MFLVLRRSRCLLGHHHRTFSRAIRLLCWKYLRFTCAPFPHPRVHLRNTHETRQREIYGKKVQRRCVSVIVGTRIPELVTNRVSVRGGRTLPSLCMVSDNTEFQAVYSSAPLLIEFLTRTTPNQQHPTGSFVGTGGIHRLGLHLIERVWRLKSDLLNDECGFRGSFRRNKWHLKLLRKRDQQKAITEEWTPGCQFSLQRNIVPGKWHLITSWWLSRWWWCCFVPRLLYPVCQWWWSQRLTSCLPLATVQYTKPYPTQPANRP